MVLGCPPPYLQRCPRIGCNREESYRPCSAGRQPRRPNMRRLPFALVVLGAVILLVPGIAMAQATISGLVQDSTGAVLPGVTVEAKSPALIEQSRTAVTDGSGRYTIVDLRPGTYAVTFSLT